MTAKLNRQVTINNTTFSFGDLLNNHDYYLQMIYPLFRVSTTQIKSGESIEEYLDRLFSLLYYQKGYRANTSARNVSVESFNNDILSNLGIDIIRHCAKTSRILFKNSGNQYKIRNENIDKLAQSLLDNKSNIKRTKTKVCIGVELEFIGQWSKIGAFKQAMINLVGEDKFSAPLRYHHNDGKQWELGTDGSLHATDGGCGFELTSPILNPDSKKDMQQLHDVIELVKSVMNGRVNKSCGTHVHMSFKSGEVTNELMKHFVLGYKMNESTLFDRCVAKTRANSRWCKPCDPYYFKHDRYRKLNMCKCKLDSDQMHLEFRQLDGTLDYDKLCTWIKLQKLFVETTMNKVKNNQLMSAESYTLEDVLCKGGLDEHDVEQLMKMSKLAA